MEDQKPEERDNLISTRIIQICGVVGWILYLCFTTRPILKLGLEGYFDVIEVMILVLYPFFFAAFLSVIIPHRLIKRGSGVAALNVSACSLVILAAFMFYVKIRLNH